MPPPPWGEGGLASPSTSFPIPLLPMEAKSLRFAFLLDHLSPGGPTLLKLRPRFDIHIEPLAKCDLTTFRALLAENLRKSLVPGNPAFSSSSI